MKKFFIILSCGILFLTSCQKNAKEEAVITVKENLKQTVESPQKYKILGISKVDSAYGVNYYSEAEIKAMLMNMKNVTDNIMSRTNNMNTFNPNDAYVIGLADKQMRATNEIRSMMFQASEKGKFSGWKIKIDYQYNDKKGTEFKAERWYILTKDGKQVLKSFELPLI